MYFLFVYLPSALVLFKLSNQFNSSYGDSKVKHCCVSGDQWLSSFLKAPCASGFGIISGFRVSLRTLRLSAALCYPN